MFNNVPVGMFIKNSPMKMSKGCLLKELQILYEKNVRPFYKEYKQKELGPWSLEEIEEHFFNHIWEPALFIRDKLDKLGELEQFQRDNIVYEDDKGKRHLDSAGLRNLCYLIESQKKILFADTMQSIAFEPELSQVRPKNRGTKKD